MSGGKLCLLVNPGADLGGGGGEADAGFPGEGGVAAAEGGVGFGYRAFIGVTEGVKGFAMKLVAVGVEEGADDGGFFVPPDGEADEDGVHVGKIDVDGLDSRTERRVEVLLSAARLLVFPVDVLGGVGFFGFQTNHYGAGDSGHLFGGQLGIARVREIDNEVI